MPKNSLYEGQKINTSEPGEQSPPDNIECPEDCPHCPRYYDDDCPLLECIYDIIDPETAGDMAYHAKVDDDMDEDLKRRRNKFE